MKKGFLVAVVTAITLMAPGAASARRPALPLSMTTARNVAGYYALNYWDPITLLPSYSLATSWDGVDSNSCLRWGRYRIDCVVSVIAQNYTTDAFGDLTGYAYCVGTLDVHKHKFGGSLYVMDEQTESCDSTYDLAAARDHR